MIITLPWPDSVLFPNLSNRKGGHFPRMEAARLYRNEAHHIAFCQAGIDTMTMGNIVSIGVDFYPPNNRRDLDGMLSAIKPGLDGIFDAICQNDKQVTEITLVKHKVDKDHPADDPRVVNSLIEAEND